MIKREGAQIEWAEDDEYRCIEVLVFDRHRTTPPLESRSLDEVRSRCVNSLGACVAGWLDARHPWEDPEASG